MKKIIFTIGIMFALSGLSRVKGQYVTISDPNFLTWLQSNYPACMNGNQMDTTCSDILNATSLTLTANGYIIDLTGIQYFANATYLDCTWNSIVTLPQLPPHLLTLNCSQNFGPLSTITMLPSTLTSLNCNQNALSALPALPLGLTNFQCNQNSFASLPSLPNGLVTLDCSTNQITVLPTLPASLTSLLCNSNLLTALPSLPTNGLITINCTGNHITSLPTLPTTLQTLDCGGNQLTALPSLPGSLLGLDCSSNQITVLPTLPLSLTYLSCDGNYLTSLPALPSALTSISFGDSLFNTFPALPSGLQSFTMLHSPFTALPALPNAVTSITCMFDSLTSLSTPLPPSLTMLRCNYCKLTTLPNLPLTINWLECSVNQITSLPSFTGITFSNACHIDNNPNLTCLPLLPDNNAEFEFMNTGIQCVPNYPHGGTSDPDLSTFPLCNVINNNGCSAGWNITGQIYADGNNNCILDSGDVLQLNKTVKLLDAGFNILQTTTTYIGGYYGFRDTVPGTYYISVADSSFPFLINSCVLASDTTAILPLITSTAAGLNVPYYCKPGFDVGVFSIFDAHRFVPGHPDNLYIPSGDYSNFFGGIHCANGVSGTVVCVINGAVTYTGYVGLAPSSVVSNSGIITVTWNIADYGLVNTSDFELLLFTDTTAIIGQQVCITVTVTPTSGDSDTLNNSLSTCITINSSYDPNEKTVSPEGDIDPTVQWLTYTIYFQNTGTAPATNIYIRDTLDSHLDPFSLQVIGYSVLPLTQVYANGVVVFNFPGINLPDSTDNEPGSHGYVQYKVKLKQQYSLGTQISNTGYIYFDYNAPVVTNTVQNTVSSTTGVGSVNKSHGEVVIYPNPNTGRFTITQLGIRKYELGIYDVMGQKVYHQTINNSNTTIDVSSLSNGVYFYQLTNSNETVRGKIIKE